jgi:asparagine synthase (glutamine-hydrolysing)
MCGIAGYINLDSEPIQDTSCIISMMKMQKHRGPDDSGIQAFSLRSGLAMECNPKEPDTINGIFEGFLGFNRLSILDLSVNAHQPMLSPDGKVLLAFNGEIYNAFGYKPELTDWGYKFKSTSDTEIVLALYIRYGFEGMLNRLNGMFAIAIIDLWKRELLITRDRFGIKPIYYIYNGKIFAFASELKSFKCINNYTFRFQEEKLDEYLLFRNNLRGTLLKDIEILEPAHFLKYTHDQGLSKRCYFNLNNYSRSVDLSEDIGSYGKRLEEWLSKSVSNQLMSDVKLGCQLSGGIDSSLVTWLANRNSEKGQFETVSIVFNDPMFSEERYIDRVTEELAIASHKFLLGSDYYVSNIERATWHFEAPLNHPNTIAIYMLSQKAKEYVTVLLSGEGADEVFGGYERFYEISYPYQSRKFLHELRKNIRHPLNMTEYFNRESRAIMATAFMTTDMAGKLRSGFAYDQATADRRYLYGSLSGSVFDRQVKYEMLSYMPDLLIRQDKMSMAHSIENRVPFLDNEVVENSFTIPEKYLLLRKSPEGYNTEKYLLKKLTADTFGYDFAFRDKMGFGVPVREFFLNPGFVVYLNDKILPDMKRRGLFNYKLASNWLSDLNRIKYYELDALWVMVSFEIWASIYLNDTYENCYTRN